MDSVAIRYGEDVTLPIDTGDTTDVSADIYIGRPGETYILTGHATLTDGVGVFTFTGEEMELPLGTYYYQINTTDTEGRVDKFPSPQPNCGECDDDFPEFIVCEALDITEVS